MDVKMRDKGYTIMIDALVALIFLLIIVTAIFSIQYSRTSKTEVMSFRELHYMSEDTLDVLNKKGILDEIATLWAENSTPGSEEMVNASNLAKEYLEKMLPPGVGYKLIIEEGVNSFVINSSNESRISWNDSTTQTHSTRVLVGYSSGMIPRGKVSRASLKRIAGKNTSKFLFFGGFVGQGNISKRMELPEDANVTAAYIEFNTGDSFDLYINNNYCDTFTPVGGGIRANIPLTALSCPDLINESGEGNPNLFELRFTGGDLSKQYIGGGFIEVQYNSSLLDTDPEIGEMRFYFPEINGVINYSSSFYVPGYVNDMLLNLSFRTNDRIFMYIGNELIFNVTGSGSKQTIINDSNDLVNFLGAASTEKTVPIRIGTEVLGPSASPSKLYSDSYIDFKYVPSNAFYGTISLTRKTVSFNDDVSCMGHVNISGKVDVSMLAVTSYSGGYWTDYLKIASDEIYNLSDYNNDYTLLGDAYIVNVPESMVIEGGINNLTIKVGNSTAHSINCSIDDRAIYTLRIKSITDYGKIFKKAEGCVWDIQFEGEPTLSGVKIPVDYSGVERCNYTSSSHDKYVGDDAVNDAVYRLFDVMDLDSDGRLDVKFKTTNVELETSTIGGVRSLWGPIRVKLILWM